MVFFCVGYEFLEKIVFILVKWIKVFYNLMLGVCRFLKYDCGFRVIEFGLWSGKRGF